MGAAGEVYGRAALSGAWSCRSAARSRRVPWHARSLGTPVETIAAEFDKAGLRRLPEPKGRPSRQNSLSCAPCCAALSLGNIPITDSAALKTAAKGIADDRHSAELSSAGGVYRRRGLDRSGAVDCALRGRVPAARSRKAVCL